MAKRERTTTVSREREKDAKKTESKRENADKRFVAHYEWLTDGGGGTKVDEDTNWVATQEMQGIKVSTYYTYRVITPNKTGIFSLNFWYNQRIQEFVPYHEIREADCYKLHYNLEKS